MPDKKLNILIIDEDLKQFEFISHFFNLDEHIFVRRASNLGDVSLLVKENSYDLIIMELKLGTLFGEELFDKIKGIVLNIPIILLINKKDENVALKLLSKGVQDFLYKDELSYKVLARSIKGAFLRGKHNRALNEKLVSKDRFCNIISKDMLVPLDGFRNLSNNLYKEYENLSESEIKEFLFDLKINSKNIFEVFDNLLVWSKIQANYLKVELEECDLEIYIKNVIKLFDKYSKKKDIKFSLKLDSEVNILKTDVKILNIILKNLFDNAIKYSVEGGIITVNLSQHSNYFKIDVIDYGAGMSEMTLNNLFNIEVINSLPGTNDEIGHGLGLIISNELVKLLDGYFEVKSNLNTGSTFSLYLPIK